MSTEPLSSVVSATAAVRPLTRLLTLACSVATVLSSAAILAASMVETGGAISAGNGWRPNAIHTRGPIGCYRMWIISRDLDNNKCSP